jgi:hypothetical protein
MRNVILAAAAVLAMAAPAYAQSTNSPGGFVVRTPPSGNGSSSGTSGSIGSAGPTYPGPLRDFNNPSVDFPARVRSFSAPRR